jgi:hypothetical protein
LLRETPTMRPQSALRRGLKYLLRACGLRAISVVELHPDPAKAAEESESLLLDGLVKMAERQQGGAP